MPRFNHDRLKRARAAARISHEQLAVDLNVSSSTIRNWEAGRTEPSATQLGVIAKRLDRPVEYFLRGAA